MDPSSPGKGAPQGSTKGGVKSTPIGSAGMQQLHRLGSAAAAASAHRRHSSFVASQNGNVGGPIGTTSASAESSPTRKVSKLKNGGPNQLQLPPVIASEANIAEFLDGPFLQWLRTFPEAPAEITFDELTSGPFLHNVLQTLDSSFSGTDSVGSENGDSQTGLKVNGHVSQSKNQSPNSSKISSASGGSKGSSGNRGGTGGDNGTNSGSPSDDFGSRVRNVQSLITSLKAYYENVLEQVVVVRLPNALSICADPITRESLAEMNTVLLLILGAAVQCNQNETVIGSIKNLPTHVQHAFVGLIQEVTENPRMIWPPDLINPDEVPDQVRKDEMYALLVRHLRTLVGERDKLQGEVVDLTLKAGMVQAEAAAAAAAVSAVNRDNTDSSGNDSKVISSNNAIVRERNHLALEVSELKAKIRGLNQEMQEKTDVSNECKEEVEKYITKCSKLRQENLELSQKAREARALKDELDVQRERAQKVQTLEAEIQVYKDKICQNESLKSRVDEMREENKILVEHKQMLEEQLESSRKRIQTIFSLENELYMVKRELGVAQMEMESDKKKIEELQEENSALQLSSKSSLSESSLMAELGQQSGSGFNASGMYGVHGGVNGPHGLHSGSSGSRGGQAVSEQLMNKDSLLIHKLELENQRLRSELDDVKLNGVREQSDELLQLEQEVKRKDLTLKQVEAERSKDTNHYVAIEKDLHASNNKVQQLEQVVTTLKEADQKTRIEKETIIENLTKQIDSLRKRGEQSSNEQTKMLEAENKKLVTANTLFEASNSRLTEEKKQLGVRLKDLESRHEETLEESEKLSQQIKSIVVEKEQLVTSKDEAIEVKSEEFTRAKEKLIKSNEKLKADVSDLYTENSRLKLQLKQSGQTADSLRAENKRIPGLEQEKDELCDKVRELSAGVENLQVSSKKLEEQEQKLVAVNLENNRILRQVENLQKKVREVEKENSNLESENQKLESHIENLKATARRVEQLERDNCELESGQHRLDREHKSLSREVHRLRESGEMKDAMIDDLNTKLSSSTREKQKLAADLDQVHSERGNLETLEQENRTLNQTLMADKKALAKLRKDLVDEKMRYESVTAKLEALQNQLQMIGIDPEAFDGQEELLSQERAHSMQGAMTQLLEGREKKLERQEVQLTALKDKNAELLQELECLRISSQDTVKTSLESQLGPVIREREALKEEMVKIKIDMDSSAKKISVYEAKLKKLQEESVEIQVENSTLQSQSTSLLSQINTLQNSNVSLEAAKKRLEEAGVSWATERKELLADQSGLQKLHDNLQSEYEALKKEKDVQREVEKQLRADLRNLQSLSVSLNEDQEKIVRAKEALDAERESMKGDTRTLANLRSEHARLKEDFRSLFTANDTVKADYRTLQSEYKGLKSSYNEMKLGQTSMRGQLEEAREQFTMLDVEHTKAVNRCEVLATLNMSLEEDRKNLMSQVSLLLTQYHDLLTQTMDDKEHFHEEERVLAEKMNHLSRQKEKLEEKIMEQYKRMENTTPKKIGLGGQLVRKMKKASTNLIGGGGNNNRNSLQGGGGVPGGSQGGTLSQRGSRRSTVPNSTSAGANLGSLDGPASGGLNHHDSVHHQHSVVHHDSCSSVGNDSNDSLGSGQHSPSPDMILGGTNPRGIGHGGASTIDMTARQNSIKMMHGYGGGVRGRPLPIHVGGGGGDDSDPGNNADCDDTNSVNSSYNFNKSRFVGSSDHMIPTRDFGPDRLGNSSSIGSSQTTASSAAIVSSPAIAAGPNHSELGIPLIASTDNRTVNSRSISRVYVNGKDVSSTSSIAAGAASPVLPVPGGGIGTIVGLGQLDLHHRSGTPNSGWKSSSSTTGSPVPSNDGNNQPDASGINGLPPSVPVRRHSRSNQGSVPDIAPQRPPKPGRLQTSSSAPQPAPEIVDSNRLADLAESDGNVGKKNEQGEPHEWYGYGCV